MLLLFPLAAASVRERLGLAAQAWRGVGAQRTRMASDDFFFLDTEESEGLQLRRCRSACRCSAAMIVDSAPTATNIRNFRARRSLIQ